MLMACPFDITYGPLFGPPKAFFCGQAALKLSYISVCSVCWEGDYETLKLAAVEKISNSVDKDSKNLGQNVQERIF